MKIRTMVLAAALGLAAGGSLRAGMDLDWGADPVAQFKEALKSAPEAPAQKAPGRAVSEKKGIKKKKPAAAAMSVSCDFGDKEIDRDGTIGEGCHGETPIACYIECQKTDRTIYRRFTGVCGAGYGECW